jgi:ketosteroid isomerase-like protein
MSWAARFSAFAWFAFPGFASAQHSAGATDFNPVDRLAIQNVISSHFLNLDSFQLDAWIANYADDAVFIVVNSGKRYEFDRSTCDKLFRERFRRFRENGDQRRHVVSNILFVSQSDQTAHVRANGVLLTTNRGAGTELVTCMAYEGWFVKRDGVWKIQKWVVSGDTKQDLTQANLPSEVRITVDDGQN